MEKLQLADFNDFSLSELSIRYEVGGRSVYEPEFAEVLGTGVFRVKGDGRTEVYEYLLEEAYLMELVGRLMKADFFRLKERYEPYSVYVSEGRVQVVEDCSLDGETKILIVRLGEKERRVESYEWGCSALEPVFDFMETMVLSWCEKNGSDF
jgi:hypothetical protein